MTKKIKRAGETPALRKAGQWRNLARCQVHVAGAASSAPTRNGERAALWRVLRIGLWLITMLKLRGSEVECEQTEVECEQQPSLIVFRSYKQ
jgi:hypothetical protein